MPIFSQLKYNNYVPQYVGAPLDEYLHASSAIQNRFDQTAQGYSLVGELTDQLQASPLAGDTEAKRQLTDYVNKSIEDAAKRGNFDQMQNEMRSLARQYSKRAAPIKENLTRYQAAEKAITESKLPQSHQAYLLQNLRSKPGLRYDEYGQPQFLTPDPFAENVDLREVYEKYINDYKSDKYPGGIRAVTDPNTGLVEYYSNTTNERVNGNEVRQGLQALALSDPKVQQFILQDAAANNIPIQTGQEFIQYAGPLMEAYTQKAAFNKQDIDFKLGEAGSFRTKKKEDELGEGYTFDLNWTTPAREGVATPSDLRKSAETLTQQRQTINDQYTRFLMNNGDPIDPLTGMSKSGVDYSDEVDLYNQQLDAVDANKWELQEIEAQAKRDAGLPSNYQPSQETLNKAQQAYDSYMLQTSEAYSRSGATMSEPARREGAQRAYNRVIDQSSDPSLKAYRASLAKNAKDRTDVRGITTFGKAARAEMDVIGDRVLAGEYGFVKAKDVATGKELENVSEYGDAVQNLGWAVDNGQVQLVYRTGTMDKSNFVPNNQKISIDAPPELTEHLIKKGYIDPVDLDISKQIGSFGGHVKLGNLEADVEIKRNAQNAPADVVVVFDTDKGKVRKAYPSIGAAIKVLNNASRYGN